MSKGSCSVAPGRVGDAGHTLPQPGPHRLGVYAAPGRVDLEIKRAEEDLRVLRVGNVTMLKISGFGLGGGFGMTPIMRGGIYALSAYVQSQSNQSPITHRQSTGFTTCLLEGYLCIYICHIKAIDWLSSDHPLGYKVWEPELAEVEQPRLEKP